MPIDFAEAFKQQPAAPPAAPAAKPEEPGLDIAAVFARRPKPPTLTEQAGAAAKKALAARPAPVQYTPGGGAVPLLANLEHTSAIRPFLDDMVSWAREYSNALHEDVKAYPQGTGDQLVQSLKTVNDALGYISTPVMSPVYTGLINPIKNGIAKLGELVDKHAAEDVYDMQARRLGQRGQQYTKGVDWAVHKADVQRTVEDLQTSVEALINAGLGFVGGEKAVKAPERPAAGARAALRDMKVAVEPAEPKLTPITVSLDKNMGFQKITENVGKELNSLPVGSTRSAASIIGDMLPHAEGYAKSFLEKLGEHIDPNTPVRFKQVAGSTPDNLGVYYPTLHQIEIKLGAPDIIHTTVHEMVHATTINMLDTLIEADVKSAKASLGRELTLEEMGRIVNNPSSPVLKELDQIVREARVRAQKAGRTFYGLRGVDYSGAAHVGDLARARMTPRYEFVAELFSNAELQEFLANSEKYASAGYKFKNMLNQFGLLIGKHLGLDKPHEMQLLNQAMRVGAQLIKMQATEKPPKARGIEEIVARTSEGETVTRSDMRFASREVARLADEQGLRRAWGSLKISIEQILRTVSPEALGRNAKLAAAVIASRITEQMQKTAMWRQGSNTRLKFWRARPDMVNEFLERFERGQESSDPLLRDLGRRYKEWGQRIFENDKKLGFDYEPRDNYLYHAFEDSEGVANYFTQKYSSKWGDPAFIKDRAFNLYKEAVAAGFRPRFYNPEDIMLARQQASDIAGMHVGILNDLASYGLATRKIAGGEKIVKTVDAEGKARFDVVKTKGTERPPNTVRWRAPNGDVFWVDSHADAILQNEFRSKSLWADRGGAGLVFRGLMAAKNALVPIRLALSLFHPLHVIGIDAAAGMTRDLAGMLSGAIPAHQALAGLLKNGLLYRSIYENPKAGWRVMQVMKGKITKDMLTEEDAQALHTLTEMGLPIEMSAQYRTNARKNFANALIDARADFRMRKPLGVAGDALRVTWHLPWALVSAMSKLVFEDWIPALKAASALKDAKALLQRNPELVENDASRLLAMRKLGKSVDNRYGEMAYNTLFWKRWVKDLAVLNTLSLGWQLGFIREYGGGAMDLGQFAVRGDKLKQIKAGQLDRPLFVAAYTTLGAGIAGLMTWGMTGEAPTSLLDYIAPRTGEKDAAGADQRVSTMFYSREFAALYKHIQNEGVVSGVSQLVLNKGSGLFGLMHEWATGVNGFGQEIRDPNGDPFQKLEQTLAYSLSDLEPISMKAIQENAGIVPGDTALEKIGKLVKATVTTKSGALSAMGFTPAPKYLTESKTVADIKTAFRSYVAPKETPFEKAEYSKEYSQLREAYQSGSDKYGELLDRMSEQFELSGKDQRRLIRSLNSTLAPSVRMFMRLPWQEQKKLLDKMTVEERDDYLPHANREHVRNVYEPPQ